MTQLRSQDAARLMGDAMDARALNHWQAERLINATPEIDCLMDHLAVLVAQGVPPSKVRALRDATMELYGSNGQEGEFLMGLAGDLDQAARFLHDQEVNGQGREWTNREIGRTLRWALPIVFEPDGHPPSARAGAGAACMRVIREVPADVLLGASVLKEIRATNQGRLLELMAAQENEGEGEAA